MTNALIERQLADSLVRVIQDQRVGQIGGKNINVQVQIVGDSAIDKAIWGNGDIKAAMRYLLATLPEPKLLALRALAMAVAYEDLRNQRKAANYLKISPNTYYRNDRGYREMVQEFMGGDQIEVLPDASP